MPQELHVALVWHMHQPYYRDDGSGRFVLPWARLRASKDYARLIDAVRRFPELRVTMNFVPSLLEQLAAYVEGDAEDAQRDLSLREASALTPEERCRFVRMMRDSAFAHRLGGVPAVAPLLDRLARQGEGAAASGLADDEIRDLQLWSLLAWTDPEVIAADRSLSELVTRGRGFTETDKGLVDRRQTATLRSVIPRLRIAVGSGQVEAMCSPAYHPILPLLISAEEARVAVPDIELPARPLRRPEDAAEQVRRGLQLYEDLVGIRPAAMWPPECAVSPEAALLMAAEGITWAISDEGVLAASLGAPVRGGAQEMSRLYRPYRDPSGLHLVFRDAELSNRVGFVYPGMPAGEAVADLVGRLEAIAAAQPDGESWLVTVALDGENCWDYYAEDGGPFLRALYDALTTHPVLRTVHVGGFLDAHPESVVPLQRLWSGSWIDGSFTTWIGDPEHTTAWELLTAARDALDAAGGARAHPQAYRELLIAEGSDWFWWFGRHHDSGIDDLWDDLYRVHLRNAYVMAGLTAPAVLDEPINRHGSSDGRGLGSMHLPAELEGQVVVPARPARRGRGAAPAPAEPEPPRPSVSRRGEGPLSVVLAAAEVAPFARVGGLADVAGALPAALARLGHRCAVMLPRHRCVDVDRYGLSVRVDRLDVPFADGVLPASLLEGRLPGTDVPVYLVDCPHFFDRADLYGAWDDDGRFAYFSRAVVEAVDALGLRPDVVHVNDWHTALVPALLARRDRSGAARPATVLTIHNIAYQGVFGPVALELAGLSADDAPRMREGRNDGSINLLAMGIEKADMVSTVSPRYAREILTPQFGAGLDGLLRRHESRVVGILSGIDVTAIDPAIDPALPAPYGVDDLSGKERCRAVLQDELGLASDPDVAMVAVVSPLVERKGIDILERMVEGLRHLAVQVVVVGRGEPRLEESLRRAARANPRWFAARIVQDDDLGRRVIAGSDLLLVPARSEPSGRAQLIAMRYGTVPVVHAVGGLADSVEEFDPVRRTGTGYRFDAADPWAAQAALVRALEHRRLPELWAAVRRNAMTQDVSWGPSAQGYAELYRMALARDGGARPAAR